MWQQKPLKEHPFAGLLRLQLDTCESPVRTRSLHHRLTDVRRSPAYVCVASTANNMQCGMNNSETERPLSLTSPHTDP